MCIVRFIRLKVNKYFTNKQVGVMRRKPLVNTAQKGFFLFSFGNFSLTKSMSNKDEELPNKSFQIMFSSSDLLGFKDMSK